MVSGEKASLVLTACRCDLTSWTLYRVRRPLDSRDRALLWRFRWALAGEKRALTRVLAAVDWGDAAEAREAAALTAAWAPVDIATALELLSPAFSNPEVHGRCSRRHYFRAQSHISPSVAGLLLPAMLA
jgi:Phosphoinositide 3-kinase family, accessory domain (PIK domain)